MTFLGIRKDEVSAVAWSFAYFLFVMSSYFMLRPVRDAMAVSSGAANIPWLFTGTMVAMLIVTPIFGWIASRYPRKRFLPWVYYFFAANMMIFFVLFSTTEQSGLDQVWVGRTFFVWLSVFNLFVVSVFWSFMADIWSRPQSRRLFGVISAGGSCGAVIGPIVTNRLVAYIEFQNLLPISAGLLIFAVACIYKLRQWVRHSGSDDAESVESQTGLGGGPFAGMTLTFSKSYFRAIATMMVLANFLGGVGYYYLIQLMGETYGDVETRIQVFALMDLTINVCAFAGQLLLVRLSVRKLGVGMTLSLLPLVSIVAFALLALNPVFVVVALVQVVRRSITFGFTKPTSDMLYAVVTPEEKYKVKTFIDTMVYRLGDSITAWTINAITWMGISGVSLICVPLAIAWSSVTMWIGKQYNRLDSEAEGAKQ